MTPSNFVLGLSDLLTLWGHFLLLSLLSVGGAITTTAEMQRFLVEQQHWLSDAQFNAAVAIAQAAPGPNLLFVALIGWTITGLAGLVVTMSGILLPSSLIALLAGRAIQRHAQSLWTRAFTAGVAPLTLGLLLSTGWVLTGPTRDRPLALALVAITVVGSVRFKLNPLWLIGLGAVVGALGGV